MKALALSIVFALTLSGQATITAPTGYRLPNDADYSGDWQDFRAKAAKPFMVQADFNGDGLPDEAWLLPATTPTGWGLFAFLGAPKGQRRVVLLDSHAREPIQRYGVSLVAPGQHTTLCGKMGYDACRPGEPAVLDLKFPAVNFYVFESANSVFWWDRQAGHFQRTWISD